MSIFIEQLTKRYGSHAVVNHVSLQVEDGEFFVLIGPSGSGKSTVLRMIAGLNTADEGRIVLHGRDVTYAPPQQRGVGFVFQNYALFRHMPVSENIEFALRVRRVPAGERRRRRDELLEIVGLAGLGNRMPRQLSGGQQQRVALARALAAEPEVLLLDEPFGALDARIRVDLRRALRQIQTQLRITTIFVTHDQEEAFELADRLGVMNFGRLLEVAPPSELYHRPQTEFVATFLGSANLLTGESVSGGVRLGPLHFALNTQPSPPGPQADRQRVQVLFRPEDVALSQAPENVAGTCLGRGEVEQQMFAGALERLRIRLPSIPGVRPIAPSVPFGTQAVLVEVTRTQDQAQRMPLGPGDAVWVGVRRIHTLAHPGMSCLLLIDGSAEAAAALGLAAQVARLAHARVTVLSCGQEAPSGPAHLQSAKDMLGSLSGLEVRSSPEPMVEAVRREVERREYDLLVLGLGPKPDLYLVEQILEAGDHHLLLARRQARPVSAAAPAPARALISVAGGEPGKQDVLFAGRLIRHLGAEATLLAIRPEGHSDAASSQPVEHFLESAARTLELLGVTSTTAVRHGSVPDEICAQARSGRIDLLVMGAPLPDYGGKYSLNGVVGQILHQLSDCPMLIVRSQTGPGINPQFHMPDRITIREAIIP